MRFKKAYRKELTKDVAIVTDEGEYPIWEKDYDRLFSNLIRQSIPSSGDDGHFVSQTLIFPFVTLFFSCKF